MRVSIHIYAIATGLALIWHTQANLLKGTAGARMSTSPALDLTGYPIPPTKLKHETDFSTGLPTLRERHFNEFVAGKSAPSTWPQEKDWDGLFLFWNKLALLETWDVFLMSILATHKRCHEDCVRYYQGSGNRFQGNIQPARVYDQFLVNNRDFLTASPRVAIDVSKLADADFRTMFPMAASLTGARLFTLWEHFLHEGLVVGHTSSTRMTYMPGLVTGGTGVIFPLLADIIPEVVNRVTQTGLWYLCQNGRDEEVSQYFERVAAHIQTSKDDVGNTRTRTNGIREQAHAFLAFAYVRSKNLPSDQSQTIFNSNSNLITKPFFSSLGIGRRSLMRTLYSLKLYHKESFEAFWPVRAKTNGDSKAESQPILELAFRLTQEGSPVQYVPAAPINNADLVYTNLGTNPDFKLPPYGFDTNLQERDERIKQNAAKGFTLELFIFGISRKYPAS
ncbi:hypothetical protein BJ085DRAFT_32163 [Dimargaris cristalligena]|uniref:ER-bound oxygenase mpaB/mpaB'/Rubber oxygenase catalytic domain-containing protein n=1 Tax=Dimargaris cristalligena TaxID=215637 RepID=A0A4P9ZL34_9FUNG|nr:hypothetical protein BJ085DRAFT_32163 [Dimargaris cristalligena]|eukprot:RKP33994.1 hypothetical protein BJ085DRAFT_32163 [Dimargaris cristalligena]